MAAAAAVDLTHVLQGAQNPDRNIGSQAEQQLKQFETQNLSSYLLSLASEVANNSKPLETRQIAGVLFKNALSPPRNDDRTALKARWAEVDAGVRQQLKQLLLATLTTQAQQAWHSAALGIAKVAALELPEDAWPELIPALQTNIKHSQEAVVKQASLEALGYVCEEAVALEEEVFAQDQVNSILTAVVEGMQSSQADPVRLAAIVALQNALEFAETNFENAQERNYLMQVVCEATLAPDLRVREAAFECLAGIASLHYNKLQPYITDIFNLTQQAINTGEEQVAKQAIEFWCTICDEELELRDEGWYTIFEKELELGDKESDGDARQQHFAQQALQPLVPVLLAQLTKQEEDQDKDQGIWNLSMAAGTCLMLFATVVGDPIIPLVLPYVQSNISRVSAPEDWRFREAATYAFGSMLEGPSYSALSQLATSGMGFLLNAMTNDPSPTVRHTTAWTLGRIFEFTLGDPQATAPIITSQSLQQIKDVLLHSIRDEAYIAEKVCYAIGQLATGFNDSGSSSTPLSPYFQEITTALLATAEKAGQEGESQLQLHAFEAINELVRSAAADTLPVAAQLLPLVLQKLAGTFQPSDQRTGDIQSLLCGVMQVLVQKLTETEASTAEVLRTADRGMEVLLAVMRSQQATVNEEALLAVGAYTYASGTAFQKYLEALMPSILLGLQNYQEQQVCLATVGVLGDICRAVEAQIAPYCDNIMTQLLSNLKSSAVARGLKPPILSCFGDIALSLGGRFEPYLTHVLSMLQSAQQLSVAQQQQKDDSNYEYNNQLRVGIFEAYSGIFHAMGSSGNPYLQEAAKNIVSFEEAVCGEKDNTMDDSAMRAAVSLLGDLTTQVQGVGALFQAAWVSQFVNECCQNEDTAVAASGQWAAEQIAKAS